MQNNKTPLILFIDDDKTLRIVFKDYLEDFGYQVICAENGKLGIDMFERFNPDLILSDLTMPEVDGLKVLETIRAQSPDTPVVMISGTGVITDAIEALHLGAWDFLTKPVENLEVLRHAVEKSLERSTLITQNRQYQQKLEEQVRERTLELERANIDLNQINSRLRHIVETTKTFAVNSRKSNFGKKLLEAFGIHMTAHGGSVYAVGREDLRLLHALDPGHAPDTILFPLKIGSIFDRVLSEKKPVLLKNISREREVAPSGWSGYRDASVLAFPLLDEAGEITGVLSLHSKTDPPFLEQDMEIGAILASYSCETLRAIRASEALRKSELRYRALFEKSPVALWEEDFSIVKKYLDNLKESGVTDFNAYFDEHPELIRRLIKMIRIIDVNDAGLKLYEAENKRQLMGSLDRILPDDAHEMLKNELISVADGEMFQIDCENMTLSGKRLNVQVKSAIPPGYETSWEKIFMSVVDFSERVALENRQKRLESQLRQAQKMESIGTLAGGIAHDFNNILSSVIGYTELTLDDLPEHSTEKKRLESVLKAGNRAKALVGQILTFSRRSEQDLQQVQVHLIVNEALKLLRSSLPTTIEIRKEIISKDWVWADPTQIHQVVMNICTNAFHAMEDTGGVLTVKLETSSKNEAIFEKYPMVSDSPYLSLSIKDSGCGMNRQTLDRIFDPYYTTKEKGKGTGLGLSVVHGIVKNHGGHISVQSEPYKGTTFTVLLPVTTVSKKQHVQEKRAIFKGNERVLLVDDEKQIVIFEDEALKRLGYRVKAFMSSSEALAEFRSNSDSYDIVITDYTMPGLTGEELSRELIKIRPDIPIIMSTGFSEQIDEGTAKGFGIKKFIMKPVSISQMAHAIREVLDET